MLLWIICLIFSAGLDAKEINIPVENSYIYGTLEESNSNHLVVLISGSGPTDRNGNSSISEGNNNSLKFLAEEIALKGFDTFRYDKRMVGKSKNFKSEDSTVFYDFVSDTKLIIEHFRQDKKYDKISIIGHSEGSLIGGIVCTEIKIDNFVSLCGLIEQMDTTVIKQITDRAPAFLEEVKGYFNQLNAGKKLDSVNPMLASLFRPSIQGFLINMLKYKPSKVYSDIKSNKIFIGGGYDMQVKGEDVTKIAKEIGSKYLIFGEMNHVLKKSPKDFLGQLATYSNPELPLYDGLVDSIVKFLNETK